MRIMWAFLVAASIIAGTPAPAQDRVDVSGTWVISMEDSGIELQSDRLRKFRRFDPGIGWPEGLSTQEDIVAGMLIGEMLIGEMQSLSLHIVQTEDEVQVTRKFTIGGAEQTITQKFALDGDQNRNPASSGKGHFVSKSNRENGKLVNLGIQTDGVREIVVKEEYRLTDNGERLVVTTFGYHEGVINTSPGGLTEIARKPTDVTLRQVFKRK